jgi:hypothetical protein
MLEIGAVRYSDGRVDKIMQVWGFDAVRQQLVAIAFNDTTVLTKHVDGWENGILIGHYDNSDMLVELRPHGVTAFDWVTRSPDDSRHFVESCKR